MRVLICVAIATALTCSAASASAFQTAAGSVSIAQGRILLTRITTTTIDSSVFPAGAALFEANGNGSQVQQLTPLQSGYFYLPGADSDGSVWNSNVSIPWLSRNYSPTGDRFLYLAGQSVLPAGNYSMSGKYYVRDALGVSVALFPGDNDLAAPGYGFLTWQPGGDEIAYANSAENQAAASQACVYLIHPDGTDARPLWCAPASLYSGPQHIQGIRWAGDGKSLIAYINWQPNGYPANWDLYEINAATGAATLVSTGIADPSAFPGTADVSYDGTKVIYQWNWDGYSPACDPSINYDGPGALVCEKDMTTGQTHQVPFTGSEAPTKQMLVSPDGSKMIATKPNTGVNYTIEDDLYLVSTADGSILRQLTSIPASAPQGTFAWRPVAWSADGTQLLTNRIYYSKGSGTPDATDVYIIHIGNGCTKHVTSGNAEDWYLPNP